jgi:hypothetical protein
MEDKALTDEAAWALATILIGDAEERKQQSRKLDAIERRLDEVTIMLRQILAKITAYDSAVQVVHEGLVG